MKVDVVYKLNNSSKFADRELKYSLRSLQKNFLDLGSLWIIGHCPDWIDKSKIGYIPFPDTFTKINKDGNIIIKLSVMCTIKELSFDFLQMSDDMIFLKPKTTKYFQTPQFNNNLIKPTHKYNQLKLFDQRIIKTREILTNHKFSNDVYESHIPYLINKEYASVVLRFPFHDGIGYLGNTLFFNTLGYNGKQKEPKTVKRLSTIDEILEGFSEYDFLNFNDYSEDENLFNELDKLFPEKSVYEL